MSIVETARKQLEEKSMHDIALASTLQGRSLVGSGQGRIVQRIASPELRMAKKDQVAMAPSPMPTPVPGQPTMDSTQLQAYVDSLSPETLKMLADIVKKKMEAKQTPVQPTPPNPAQGAHF